MTNVESEAKILLQAHLCSKPQKCIKMLLLIKVNRAYVTKDIATRSQK